MDEANQSTILKRDALGRVFIPEAKREELLDEFERSGLKGAQFARAAGICYQTFACWVVSVTGSGIIFALRFEELGRRCINVVA